MAVVLPTSLCDLQRVGKLQKRFHFIRCKGMLCFQVIVPLRQCSELVNVQNFRPALLASYGGGVVQKVFIQPFHQKFSCFVGNFDPPFIVLNFG